MDLRRSKSKFTREQRLAIIEEYEIVKHQSANRKYIESGHLFIDNNDRTFDARGQQVR